MDVEQVQLGIVLRNEEVPAVDRDILRVGPVNPVLLVNHQDEEVVTETDEGLVDLLCSPERLGVFSRLELRRPIDLGA
ncbi:hypothetical protein D3C86_1897050 [compost metagenome]